MRHLTTYLIVALLMFTIGVSAYAAWAFFSHSLVLEKQVIPVSQLREDNLHKLYEAVQMTGRDWHTKNMMLARLICARDDGAIDARMIDARMVTGEHSGIRCQRDDGVAYEFNIETGAYGVMFNKIRKEHSSWSLRNLEFLREVSTPEKAKDYVHQHMSELLP